MSVATPRQSRAASSPPDFVALARARHASGTDFVWLDSATAGHDSVSVFAADPAEVLQGDIWRDRELLRAALQRGAREHHSGGLFGWVGFDGRFIFGCHDTCYISRHGNAASGPTLHATPADLFPNENDASLRLKFTPQMDKATFCALVRRAQEYIAAGDIYQVNLSYPWLASWPRELDSLDFYLRLRAASPAPYGGFLDLGGTQVFSSSPEGFLEMEGRRIVTRPIKGTRPRGATPERDRELAQELERSTKERAELVMITDLERNDLGQVCEFGSVRVTGLLKLERYAQVQHLVSTVEGTLRSDVGHLDAFLACFPGGSISGAPKKRALEIIHELEPHDRGLYTGAIGWFGFQGESRFSIAIRTAWREGDTIRFDTGAGIVADSDPSHEWEETRHKAQGLLRAASSR
jgi:para-aminobenzoate synthetase component 1